MDDGTQQVYRTEPYALKQRIYPYLECWDAGDGIAITASGTGIYTIDEVSEFVDNLIQIGRDIHRRNKEAKNV